MNSQKEIRLENLSNENYIINALAIDQRGSLKKMFQKGNKGDDINSLVEEFKCGISEILTPFASSILLDPEYGLPAKEIRDKNAGLLLAYEETGYDATQIGRLPDLLPNWSAKRISEAGADAVKFLLYFDNDEPEEINDVKKTFVERIGSECLAEDIPFFLEILTYDSKINDEKGIEFAKIKPRKVIEAMKIFSDKRYNVDVLKVEVPVNMNYVEGFNGNEEVLYTKEEAAKYFNEQEKATDLPYIYLSAGVSMELFMETLKFANDSGAKFNGVLCGRATWKGAVEEFSQKGKLASEEWLKTKGVENIKRLKEVIEKYATPWK